MSKDTIREAVAFNLSFQKYVRLGGGDIWNVTSLGLGEMFEDDFADTCAAKISAFEDGGKSD